MLTLAGATMGVIGLGGIGLEVAGVRVAGMRVIGTRRSVTAPAPRCRRGGPGAAGGGSCR